MLKQTIKKIFKPKNYLALALVLLVVLIAPVKSAHAGVEDVVLQILGYGISFFVSILSLLLSVVISAVVEVAQYNKFLSAPPVAIGWGIVRDLCNMFFVLILLIIAFATILHIPNYSIKQLLKRVIIFAILINFSKMICGLLIDFAQVIMLTFVNGFKDIGGANMSTLLGMDKLLSLDKSAFQAKAQTQTGDNSLSFWSVVGSYFLAWIYVIIMLVVMIALLGTLVFRIITLWIYIILSPLAYLGAVAPMTSGITKSWWHQFSQSLITGPILAFFIWLSLATLGQYGNSRSFLENTGFNVPDETVQPHVGETEVGTTAHMMRFAISIGLLIGGLMVAKSFGGAAGAAAGAGMSRIQGGAGWLKKQTVGRAQRGAVAAAKGTGRLAWTGAKATGRVGLGLAKTIDYKATKGLVGAFGGEYKAGQGLLTRGAGGVYNNLMTKEGLKNTFNKATRNKFNNDLDKQRLAATEAKSHVKNGVKYTLDESNDKGEFKSDNGRVLEDFTAFKKDGWSKKYSEFKHASTGGTAKDNAQAEKSKKDYDELAKVYSEKSKEELWSLVGGTTSTSNLKGMFAALAAKGEFRNQEMFNKAQEVFSNNPAQLKALRTATQEKQGSLVYDPTDPDQKAVLTKLGANGKMKFENQTFDHFETDPKKNPNAEIDRDKMADFIDALKEKMRPERWDGSLNKFKTDADPRNINKVVDAFDKMAKRKDAEIRNAEAAVLIAERQLQSEQQKQQANPNLANQQVIDSLTAEKDRLVKERDDNKVKRGRDLTSAQADRLFLDENGDADKSFKDKNNHFNTESFARFISKASKKQLESINPDSIANNPEAINTLVDRISNERLKTLEKGGVNPDLARMIAENKAKNYDPETPKIVNIYNDIDANLGQSKINGWIKDALKDAGKMTTANNLGLANASGTDSLNGIRKTINYKLTDEDKFDKKEVKKLLKNSGII